MRPDARLLASIEILTEILDRHRPASLALADWGRARRFAGSGDRGAIGNLVYDALRRRASIAWRMGSDSPRSLALGALRFSWELSADEIAALCGSGPHSPAPLTNAELAGLERALDETAPPWVLGDYPEWLHPSLSQAFGGRTVAEGAALASRAPIDLRVNTLKATRDKVLKTFEKYGAEPTRLSPVGVRLPARAGAARSPHVEAETAHGRGWFEVQDEGSQLAALLSAAGPRQQVLDLCAGAGGKTLALSALMQNTGQIYAYDSDKLRLRPIFERLKRAGARNVQTLPGGDESSLAPLRDRMDLVVADAPCTGSGVWRRKPDSKWRLTPQALAARVAEQSRTLAMAAAFVRPGGRLIYITCSVLPEENSGAIAPFCAARPDFHALPYKEVWRAALGSEPPPSADGGNRGLLLSPLSHGTDGFFLSALKRNCDS
jgi:16S rRNA (cytosine967-C5)-methyltransferase